MSYCRFSSDNWKSDVYAYADVGGYWQIWVASNRTKEPAPELPDLMSISIKDHEDLQEWSRLHNAQLEWLKTAEREQITLPYAGKGFQESTAKECAQRLLELQGLGYYVPQYAIDELLDEREGEWDDVESDVLGVEEGAGQERPL